MSRNVCFHSSFLSSHVWIIRHQSLNQNISLPLSLFGSTSVTYMVSIYWKYNILLKQWRRLFNFHVQCTYSTSLTETPLFIRCEPNVAHVNKDVNWLESASLDMHNYVSWCLRISMRLYFAILGVGKRSLWCAGFTDPPKPSGWYRKYIGNRTIEETSANQKILNTDVTRTDKLIGQYRF